MSGKLPARFVVITGGRVWTAGPAGTIARGEVLIDTDRGTLVEVGERVSRPAGAAVVDAMGLDVTPGLVDAHTHMGLQEPFWGGGDANEATNPLNPHLHVLDAYDPLDPNFRDAAAGGVTTFALLPGAPVSFGDVVEGISLIAGRGAVLRFVLRDGDRETPAEREVRRREDEGKLGSAVRGWIATEVLRAEAGMKLALGEHPKQFFTAKSQPPATRLNIVALLRESLTGARDYRAEMAAASASKEAAGATGGAASAPAAGGEAPPKPRDLRKEALAGLLAGDYPAHIHVHRARDIEQALRLADEFGFRPVLHHVTEGYLVGDELARRGVPCVVGPLPFTRRGPELKNLTPALAARLHGAGVKVAIATDAPTYPSHYLPLHAGMAVREGLPETAALEAITSVPAAILGVSGRVGSLEPGKDADVVLWRGHPLDSTTRVAAVYIQGRAAVDRLGERSESRPARPENRPDGERGAA